MGYICEMLSDRPNVVNQETVEPFSPILKYFLNLITTTQGKV